MTKLLFRHAPSRAIWISVLAGAAMPLLASAQCAPGDYFPSAAIFPVGNANLHAASGDINKDGNLDLIVSPFFADPDVISIVLGNGDGTFQSPSIDLPLLSGPARSAEVADFNNDGNPDLVVLTGQVEVLLGNGDGTFAGAVTFNFGNMFKDVEVGHLNEDSNIDIVASDRDTDAVMILLGDGTGSFAESFLAVGDGPTGIELVDMDNDGNLDLVTGLVFDDMLSVNLGTGTGSFGGATLFAVGDPEETTHGDFDNDGNMDIAVQNDNAGTIEVLMGNGDGTLDPLLTIVIPDQLPGQGFPVPLAIGAADLDGDGDDDIVTANFGINIGTDQGSSFGLVLSNGDGTFTVGPNTYVSPANRDGDRLRSIIFGDFDNDGDQDVAGVVNAFVAVALNQCSAGPVCAADLTGSTDPNDPGFGVPDGILDANDFFFYLGLFGAGDLSADLTGSINPNDPGYGVPDGSLDANDFFFYLDLFAAGCP